MNEIKNKKGDTVKVVLIIVLLILLIASMSFTVYDKFIKLVLSSQLNIAYINFNLILNFL